MEARTRPGARMAAFNRDGCPFESVTPPRRHIWGGLATQSGLLNSFMKRRCPLGAFRKGQTGLSGTHIIHGQPLQGTKTQARLMWGSRSSPATFLYSDKSQLSILQICGIYFTHPSGKEPRKGLKTDETCHNESDFLTTN